MLVSKGSEEMKNTRKLEGKGTAKKYDQDIYIKSK